MKDAVIAAAILVVLLLLWRLLKHPEQLGTAGPMLKTALFGSYGAALAGHLAGNGGKPSASKTGATVARAGANELPVGPTNPAFLVVSQARPPGATSAADDPSANNDPVKVIGNLPTDLIETAPPATTSPDAAAMARHLDAAGAKTGDIQLSLSWNDYNDLDLDCVDPRGERIWYSHKRSLATGGELDIDRNASEPFVASPVENIYWPTGGAPPGIYKLNVIYYAQHGSRGSQPTPYTVRVVVQGKTNYLTGRISYTGRKELHWICTFQYDPNNPDPARHRRFLSNR